MMNLKVTVKASTTSEFVGAFPPKVNAYASGSLIGSWLAALNMPDGVSLEENVHAVACQGPASGAGAVIVTAMTTSPLALKEVRVDVGSMAIMHHSVSQPLPYGCSVVLRYGVQSLQPSPVAETLLRRYAELQAGGRYSLVEVDDDELKLQFGVMVSRLTQLTFIPNWPKHEMQGSTFIVPGFLPHAVGAAFGLADAADAFAIWADQCLLWRPIANGVPPKSSLYPTLCTAVNALGEPILQGDGRTPVPQTVPDAQHIQGQQLAWAWLLYGDAPAMVELLWQWAYCKKFNVYADPAKEENQRAFGRVGEFTFWVAVSCPDMEQRFAAQHHLKWWLEYMVSRAKQETINAGVPVITLNHHVGGDHKFNKVSTWQTATNGRAPALVMRFLALLDLLTDEERMLCYEKAEELLGLVANCMCHAINLGLEKGVPFVRDYDDQLQPVWNENGAVSGTDAWVLPTLRDILELLPEYPLRELIGQGLFGAFELADCLKVKVNDPPADLQAYEMLGIALDLMPSLGIKL